MNTKTQAEGLRERLLAAVNSAIAMRMPLTADLLREDAAALNPAIAPAGVDDAMVERFMVASMAVAGGDWPGGFRHADQIRESARAGLTAALSPAAPQDGEAIAPGGGDDVAELLRANEQLHAHGTRMYAELERLRARNEGREIMRAVEAWWDSQSRAAK